MRENLVVTIDGFANSVTFLVQHYDSHRKCWDQLSGFYKTQFFLWFVSTSGLIQNIPWELYNVNWITSIIFISVKLKSDVRYLWQKRGESLTLIWFEVKRLHFTFCFIFTVLSSITDWYIHKGGQGFRGFLNEFNT